jgi:hypothetical protein
MGIIFSCNTLSALRPSLLCTNAKDSIKTFHKLLLLKKGRRIGRILH